MSCTCLCVYERGDWRRECDGREDKPEGERERELD